MLPLNDFGVVGIHELEFKAAKPASGRYVYYPGTTEIPEASAARTLGNSFKILAEVEFTGDSQGVIFSQGSRFGGYTMFVKGGKLTFVYNFLGIPPEQRLTCDAQARQAHRRCRVHQEQDRREPRSAGKDDALCRRNRRDSGISASRPATTRLAGEGLALACRRVRSHGQVIRAHTIRTIVTSVSRYTGHGPNTSSSARGRGFPVEIAVIGTGDCIEGEDGDHPYESHDDREAVAAPGRPHPTPPREIDGRPYNEHVKRKEREEKMVWKIWRAFLWRAYVRCDQRL